MNGQTYLIDSFGSIAHRELIAPIPACQGHRHIKSPSEDCRWRDAVRRRHTDAHAATGAAALTGVGELTPVTAFAIETVDGSAATGHTEKPRGPAPFGAGPPAFTLG